MRLQDKLQQLKAERKAILAANFYNFETLSGILQAASLLKMPVILQLSESSGIPDAMLQEAIRNGVCKINLATETKNTFMLALQERLKNNSEIDLRVVFPDATRAVTSLIVNKLKIIHLA